MLFVTLKLPIESINDQLLERLELLCEEHKGEHKFGLAPKNSFTWKHEFSPQGVADPNQVEYKAVIALKKSLLPEIFADIEDDHFLSTKRGQRQSGSSVGI